jgi:EAL domain-containing protein (putative c-di-GMP-specific phosphodiesterase class I)/DNA-binding NarL/FixJ family response regulator
VTDFASSPSSGGGATGGTGVSPIRVLIAEDDEPVRKALAALVGGEPSMTLVGTAPTGDDAIELARREQPHVALVDVRMPGGGPRAVRGILRVSAHTKILALSGADDRETVLGMLEAGVVGYLVKGVSIAGIIESIERAAEGQGSLSVEVTGDVIQELVSQLGRRRVAEEEEQARTQRVRRAIDEDDALSIVFQPICILRGGEIVGVEALARFDGRSERGPEDWFAEAGLAGLRGDLELAAVRKSLAALDTLADGQYLSVNVSPPTLAGSRFRSLLEEADPKRIIIEVTEHAPIHEYESLEEPLAQLKRLGVRLAIDDAGAGFASLRHILRLSPDVIKLDHSLIDGIEDDRSQQALTAGLVSFAEELGSTLIAEGIEQRRQLEVVASLGVELGQGFLFARPGPLSAANGGISPNALPPL